MTWFKIKNKTEILYFCLSRNHSNGFLKRSLTVTSVMQPQFYFWNAFSRLKYSYTHCPTFAHFTIKNSVKKSKNGSKGHVELIPQIGYQATVFVLDMKGYVVCCVVNIGQKVTLN